MKPWEKILVIIMLFLVGVVMVQSRSDWVRPIAAQNVTSITNVYNGSLWNQSGANAWYVGGNVGVGMTDFNLSFQVNGSGQFLGNVTANYFIGDGSLLTGISATGGGNGSNVNGTDINVTKVITPMIESPYINKSYIQFLSDGSIKVLLDPVDVNSNNVLSSTTDQYTPSTETHCKGGICSQVLYSGIRRTFEDNEWKLIENAKSLKNSGIDCVVKNDGVHIAECLDWNYTHRKIKSSISALSLVDKSSIPLSIITRNGSIKSKSFLNYNIVPQRDEWIAVDYEDTIKIGERSTTIGLSYNNSMTHVTVYPPDDSLSGSLMIAGNQTTSDLKEYNSYFGFLNLSDLDSEATIVNAEVFLSHISFLGTAGKTTAIYFVNDTSWSNYTTTHTNQPCGIGWDDAVKCNLTILDNMTVNNAKQNFTVNVTSAVVNAHNNNFTNISFGLHQVVYGAKHYFASQSHSDVPLRPYLNISYLAPSGITTTLNSPANDSIDSDGVISFSCTATATASSVYSVELYHNISGTWESNQTITTPAVTEFVPTFNITGVPDETKFRWNCYSTNNQTKTDFGNNDWIIDVLYKTPKLSIYNVFDIEKWWVDARGDMYARDTDVRNLNIRGSLVGAAGKGEPGGGFGAAGDEYFILNETLGLLELSNLKVYNTTNLTSDVYLFNTKSASTLGTDADGKIIEGSGATTTSTAMRIHLENAMCSKVKWNISKSEDSSYRFKVIADTDIIQIKCNMGE